MSDSIAPTGITLWGGITFIVGSIIGTGIFSNGGRILELTGSPGMAMVLWAFGAFVAFCGGFSYVEWGTRIPASGGDLPYLSCVYGKRSPLPFLYMWYRVVLALPGTTAALATTVGKYAIYAFPLPNHLSSLEREWVVKGIAAATIISLFLLCAFSNTIAKNGIKYVTFFKMMVVGFVFCCGIAASAGAFPSLEKPHNFANAFQGTSTSPSSYAAALFKVFFCYNGWSSLAMTMGELQNPQRNIPRSIIGGVFIVAVMYIGANLSYLLVLPAAEVKGISEELAAVFASRLFGDFFSRKIMSLLVLLSAYGCGFAVTFGSSRMIVAAAEQEFLPKSEFFARIHPSFKTPFNALVLYVCLALVLLLAPPSDTYFFLIDVIGYPTWIFFIITMSGLLILRFKKHGHTIGEEGGTGSFRVWLICPIVVICAGLFLSVLPFFKGGTTTLAAAAGLATLLLGFPVYYFQVYRRDHHRMNNNRTTVLISTNTPPTKSKELKR